MSDQSKVKKEVKPLNPFYVSMPFLFRQTGEVKRLKSAGRFTKKLQQDATRLDKALEGVTRLIITDDKSAYLLNADQVELIRSDAANIQALYLNGFTVRAMPDDLIAYLPVEYQID